MVDTNHPVNYRERAARASAEHKWKAAEEIYQLAVEQAEQLSDGGLQLAGTLNDFGLMYIKSDDYLQAEKVFDKSLALSEKKIADTAFSAMPVEQKNAWQIERAKSVFQLANTERELGNYDAAEKNYKRALSLQKQLGADKLGGLPIEQEYQALQLASAQQSKMDARVSMQTFHLQWRKEHNYKHYGRSHKNLLDAISSGSVAEVERLEPITLTEAKTEFGEQSTEYVLILRELATFYGSHNLFDKAIFLLNSEVKGFEASLPRKTKAKTDPNLDSDLERIRVDLVAISNLYDVQGKHDQAIKALEKAIVYTKREEADTCLEEGDLDGLIANQHAALGHKLEAEKQYKAAIKLKLARCGNKSIQYANALCNLGGLYLIENRYAEAKPLLEGALKIFGATTDGDSTTRGYISQTIGIFYDLQGKYDQAIPLLSNSVDQINQWGGPKDVAGAWYHLGNAYKHAGKLNEAASALEQTVHIYDRSGLPDSREYVAASCLLAETYDQLHEGKRAESLYKQALAASRELNDAQMKADCLSKYKTLLIGMGRNSEAAALKP